LEKERNKELIIAPPSTISNLELFLDELKEINILFIDPTKIKRKKNFKIIYESELADIIICKSIEDLIKNKTKDKSLAFYKRVLSNEDISDIENAIYKGANYIIVDAANWKSKY
jgi:3-dehydroquinate synthase II